MVAQVSPREYKIFKILSKIKGFRGFAVLSQYVSDRLSSDLFVSWALAQLISGFGTHANNNHKYRLPFPTIISGMTDNIQLIRFTIMIYDSAQKVHIRMASF